MADPQIAGGIRVQAVWQGVSNLPEDRYVTTWAFSSDAATSEAAKQEAMEVVRGFYTTLHSGSTSKVSDFIAGPAITETLSGFRAYSMADAPPREPSELSLGGATFSNQAPLPSEVAVCLSFYADRNLPGSRGRVYVGPLNQSAAPSEDGPARVALALRQAMAAAGNAILADQAGDASIPVWCVLGKGPTGDRILQPITAGWVDNAFDTQHRRGEDATARLTWGAP